MSLSCDRVNVNNCQRPSLSYAILCTQSQFQSQSQSKSQSQSQTIADVIKISLCGFSLSGRSLACLSVCLFGLVFVCLFAGQAERFVLTDMSQATYTQTSLQLQLRLCSSDVDSSRVLFGISRYFFALWQLSDIGLAIRFRFGIGTGIGIREFGFGYKSTASKWHWHWESVNELSNWHCCLY